MPTRTQIRTVTIALLKAHAATAALVGTRVYDEAHAPYPDGAPHPAIVVLTPGGDSAGLSADGKMWRTDEQLVVQCIVRRDGGQSDATLSANADALERAARGAVLRSNALLEVLDVESITQVRIEKSRGESETGTHRIFVDVTFVVPTVDEFPGDNDEDVDLNTLRVALRPNNDDSTPDIVADVTT
jgi:hypothetical protein